MSRAENSYEQLLATGVLLVATRATRSFQKIMVGALIWRLIREEVAVVDRFG
jgi:hypothetical protein